MNLEFIFIYFLQAVSLIMPILISGVYFVYVIRNNKLKFLNIPIDGGLKLNSKRLIGDNKTYRGVVIYIIGSIMVSVILHFGESKGINLINPVYKNNPIILGLLVGVCYSTGEIINSIIKRRFNIKPGSVHGNYRFIQRIIDRSDGIIFSALVLSLIYKIDILQIILAVLIAYILHYLIEIIMQKLSIK